MSRQGIQVLRCVLRLQVTFVAPEIKGGAERDLKTMCCRSMNSAY